MESTKDLLEECVYHAPLTLLTVPNIDEYILKNFLPYSIGIEIECEQNSNFDVKAFNSIPDIMHVQVDSYEQRYRIPRGLPGLICLYNICNQLKVHSELNEGSGIHYHVDMTDCFSRLNNDNVKANSPWILNELDTWGYTGTYNNRECLIDCRCWVNFQSRFKTAEIRIAEMTFDYQLMVRRIVSASKIIGKLKEKIHFKETFEVPEYDRELLIEYYDNVNLEDAKTAGLVKLLKKLEGDLDLEFNTASMDEANKVIKNRVIKI